MKLFWTETAQRDLQNIRRYLVILTVFEGHALFPTERSEDSGGD
jgi:plasmid stabilization system protein ParE